LTNKIASSTLLSYSWKAEEPTSEIGKCNICSFVEKVFF